MKLFRDKNYNGHWGTIRATVGLIRNLSLSQTIIPNLCEQNTVQKLIELLMNLERDRLKLPEDNQRFDALMESIVITLTSLAKDSTCRAIIRDMNGLPILMRVNYS